MKVKVLCLGRSAKEIEVDAGTTVEQAIQKAEFPKDNSYTRHVNGSHCMDSDILNDGDVLTLVPQVKGGSGLSRDLLQFYAQRYHVSIVLHGDTEQGIVIDYPLGVKGKVTIDGQEISHDADYQHDLEGRLVIKNDIPILKISDNQLIFLFSPDSEYSTNLMKQLLEEHLPILSKQYRRQVRKQFINQLVECADDRKRSLETLNRDNEYEIQTNLSKIHELSKEISQTKQMLEFFDKSQNHLQQQAVRMFVDLMKLVPGLYQGFKFEEDVIIGITQPITIIFEDHEYNFDPYEVRIDLNNRCGTILGNSNEINGYIHPHVNDNGEVCWGNIRGLIPNLLGQLDIYGLFQLIHNFLSDYNNDDPYQRIENWDPYWEGDQEEEYDPYCVHCEESGHEAEHCDYCWYCPDCYDYHDSDETCPKKKEEENEKAA
jgi:sulfur carrier protein ThiS